MTVDSRQTFQGREYAVDHDSIHRHTAVDVAVVRVEGPPLSPLDGALMQAPIVAKTVYTRGYPKLPGLRDASVTMQPGAVTNESVVSFAGDRLFLFSAISRPGNSGGPVVSEDGYLVGLSIVDATGQYPANEAFSPHYAGIPAQVVVQAVKDPTPHVQDPGIPAPCPWGRQSPRPTAPAAGEDPGGAAGLGSWVRPAGVRGEGGRGEAAGGRRRALERSRGGTGRGKGIHLHHRRRSIHVSPASETRTSKRLRPGLSWRSGVIQTMRASTRRVPRARDVFSGIRPMASSAIRNQTWSPADQKVPFGSRVGSRAVRVLAPPGPVLARPLDDDRQLAYWAERRKKAAKK